MLNSIDRINNKIYACAQERKFNFLNLAKILKKLSIRAHANYLEISAMIILIIIFSSICLDFSNRAVIVDSDSGFEYTNAQNILLKGKVEHGPVLQQFIYALILGIFGLNYKNILILQSVITVFVVLVTFQFIKRQTNFYTATITSMLFLFFPIFYFGTYTLKQYPLFLLLLTLSIYYFDTYLKNKEKKRIFVSSIFLGLATITHLICLPFLGFVSLYYVCMRIRGGHALNFKEVSCYYIILFLTISPYVIWRLLVDGFSLDLLLTYPASWGTIKYGKMVDIYFWGMNPFLTPEYYIDFLKLLSKYVFLPILSPFLFLGLIKYPDKKLLLSWFLALLSPYLIGRGVVSWIYTYPFLPLVLIITAHGVFFFTQLHTSKRIKLICMATILCLLFTLSIFSYIYVRIDFENKMSQNTLIAQDINEFNKIIPEGSNILFRSRAISTYLPQKNILMITKDLSEEDAVTYLNWENDEEVVKILMKYNISYVILYIDTKWEKDYHVWFKFIKGYPPNHYYEIDDSPYFQKLKEGTYFKLYKLNASLPL